MELARDQAEGPVGRLRRCLPFIGVFVVGLVLMLAMVLPVVQRSGLRSYVLATDFRAYYTAGAMALNGVRDGFYDLATQYTWQQGFVPEMVGQADLLVFLNPLFVAVAVALLLAGLIVLSLMSESARWRPVAGVKQ